MVLGSVAIPVTAGAASGLSYPPAERTDHVDTYFGVEVADPYRWLEDPADARTQAWVDAQASLATTYLADLPTRASRAAQMAELISQPSVGQPVSAGGRLFWVANDGTQAQSVLYQSTSDIDSGKVLLDPHTLSADGTVSLSFWIPSPNGRYVAWATSEGGSDWKTWRVRDVRTGKDLPEHLRWSKFSYVAWTADSSGFYYARYPKPQNPLESVNVGMQVHFHRLGQSAARSTFVYTDRDRPETTVRPSYPPGFDRQWIRTSTPEPGNGLSYIEGTPAKPRVVELPLPQDGSSYAILRQTRDHIIVQTDHGAPLSRIVRIDLDRPAPQHWQELVPERAEPIELADIVDGRIVVTYLSNASSRVRIFSVQGRSLGTLPLPGIGAIVGLSDREGPGGFLSYTSFTQPTEVLTFSPKNRTTREWYAPPVPFDPADFITEQVWTTSKDGTRVPAFVSRLRTVTPDPTTPTWLYGYGGFDISLTPAYSSDAIAWMQNGGVYVVATLRGGGEFGQEWHRAGTLQQKQNVFDDFIGVAEWLVAEGRTSPEHLVANGRSNGGLLAGAMLTQRPDLFGAVVPEVGVLDMLRYHNFTIGYAWAGDYGRSDDSPEMFEYLRGYSPLHNVRAGVDYPPTLVMTAARDDRVVPAHSFKFAATLQHANPDGEPMLIRIETQAGHGAGSSLQQRIDRSADRLAFMDAHVGTPAP
jgi:prolyl oligopeptidase